MQTDCKKAKQICVHACITMHTHIVKQSGTRKRLPTRGPEVAATEKKKKKETTAFASEFKYWIKTRRGGLAHPFMNV